MVVYVKFLKFSQNFLSKVQLKFLKDSHCILFANQSEVSALPAGSHGKITDNLRKSIQHGARGMIGRGKIYFNILFH